MLKIIDVGTRTVDDTCPYAGLVGSGRANVVGFDADPAGCSGGVLNYAIAYGMEHTFYHTADGQSSSLLEPDAERLARYKVLPHALRVVRTERVQTRSLDELPECAGADYLKIDAQGADLLVLEGAVELLRGVTGVTVEVLFGPMYKGQAYFGDIDQFMRRHGFTLYTFMKPLGDGFAASPGTDVMLLWSDALYIRDPFMKENWTDKMRDAAPIIAREIFRSDTLADELASVPVEVA